MKNWIKSCIRIMLACTAGIPFTGLVGCMSQDPINTVAATPSEAALTGEEDPAWIQAKSAEWTDSTTGKRYILDPVTKEKYLLNPNRKLITSPQFFQGGLPKTSVQTNSQVDWSGQVETRWYECKTESNASINTAITCQVELGFVLVGGGAYVDYTGCSGALLTETRPLDGTLISWAASSKDHLSSCSHKLFVYAIGLRLKRLDGTYVPSSTLRSRMAVYYRETTENVQYPTSYTYNWGRTMEVIGGGAKIVWSNPGNLLIRSLPHTCTNILGYGDNCRSYSELKIAGWFGAGKDNSKVSKATIIIDDIRLDIRDWPGFGQLEIATNSSSSFTPSKVIGTSKVSSREGWVMTCPGADANPKDLSSPPSRLLFGLRPEFQSNGQAIAAAYSKDHHTESSGDLMVTAVMIRKKP